LLASHYDFVLQSGEETWIFVFFCVYF
jgi:hypothetical protein